MRDGRREGSEEPRLPLRRVRKGYEQVADQLRELIVTGELPQGGRLPTETALARELGVSRATVREALRLLAAQGLVRTAKGQTGGSYVTLPTVAHVSESLSSNIALLADARDLTLEELIEVRVLLEVPAARLAARRRAAGDVERLRATIPPDRPALDTQTEFVHNRDFHATLIECCENRLLQIAAQPVFSALQTSLSRSGLPRDFHRAIHAHHARIVEAVEAGDEDGAAREMNDHLAFLVPYYEKAWKAARLPLASGA
ncbi:MAG TPA: FCD domain-containing protein [Gaiella sp.]|nr:FCD domain-containing protein [Gaiella sp.]